MTTWAIFHPYSGRIDGWYSKKDTAEGVLDYFREEFPKDKFTLVTREEFGGYAVRDKHLRASEAEQWSIEHLRKP